MIILVPLFFIAINEQYFTEGHVIEEIPVIVRPDEDISEPVAEDTAGILSIAEGILAEWNVNIWSDLQKLFN